MARLSEKQESFLRTVAASEASTDDFPEGVPFYTRHTYMEFDFYSAGDRERWYQNLETRGLITRTGNGKCFVRLTDAGRAALASIDAAQAAAKGASDE